MVNTKSPLEELPTGATIAELHSLLIDAQAYLKEGRPVAARMAITKALLYTRVMRKRRENKQKL